MSSLWIDVKYVNLLAPRLLRFKQKDEYLWNFRCPVCGDSKKRKNIARGYIYRKETGLFVRCYNECGYSTNLGNFIKFMDEELYKDYVFENYKDSGIPRSPHKDAKIAVPAIIKKPELSDQILDPIKRLDKLRLDHPAVQYVLNRKIPLKNLHLFYFAPRFKRYVNILLPGKFSDEKNDHPRLIIPYFNSFGKCFAFQARAFKDEEPKYFTIKIDDSERIYGLDRVDYSKRIYIVEGPIDSLFIPNAIAVSGSSFITPTIEALKANVTVVYDNEPRAPDITKHIRNVINKGYNVCLWPDNVTAKDINEMVMNGMSSQDIVDIINQNTYQGLEAQVRFVEWKKC